MDDDAREKIETWAHDEARKDNRISAAERIPLNDYARDRYAFERGLYEHALTPHWGVGLPMADIVREMGADSDRVADFIRDEVEDGDDAAEQFLTSLRDSE